MTLTGEIHDVTIDDTIVIYLNILCKMSYKPKLMLDPLDLVFGFNHTERFL